ncbi:MAG TPA: hypothetical protein PK788_03550 [Gemmatimonadaceae bacterium]|nr:hypothetical protein [Gemmatimonadaceae bacterium]HRQ78136.1 hypothetical protein [Gemmatimonadaceae bacterium]
MNGRRWLRLPLALALAVGMMFGGSAKAEAQSLTQDAVKCVDDAANELKKCVDDLPWYAEALCYARYASDGILCAPSVLFQS